MRKATFHFDSNIHYNPSCPKLPASWQSKLSFRRSSTPHTVLGTVLWWPIFKHCSKKAYHFQEQFILNPFVANVTHCYSVSHPVIPALPIWTASLVSLPWRTDFSFLCMLDFFLSLSSPSPPSALFSGCISMAAAPSCCLADNAEQNGYSKIFSTLS